VGALIAEWLNLLVRWIHLITGIMWIGSSFYFMWLDAALEKPDPASKKDTSKVEGELWMCHSGGFYQVEKRLIGPGEMPKTLHWFKWEATFTWMSGIALLAIVYYWGGGLYLIDPSVSSLSVGSAVALSLGTIIVTWLAYDLLWLYLGARIGGAATAVSLVGAAGLAYGLCHAFSGRAAFIHLGAVFGTIMVANVWVRILPAQQKMIDATREGRKPDYKLGQAAKRRSVHNSYMTFPVLFMMLSNHYPALYGHQQNWLILILLVLFGASVRHVMLAKTKTGRWVAVPAAAASLAALVAMTAPPGLLSSPQSFAGDHVSFQQAKAVIQSRCVVCHAAEPADRTFGPSPGGANFEHDDKIVALAERIRIRAVETKTMPLANKTAITEDERAVLARWISQGARLE
jgi:uncharacterized membrane protein